MSRSLEKLIKSLSRLPGIGEKTAGRLAYHLLKCPEEQARQLSESIGQLRENVFFCPTCGNITEEDPCDICRDKRREREVVCVVEEPADIRAIETSGSYRGLYHVLGGRLSPLDGVGPDELSLDRLLQRIETSKPRISELIVATNPSVEGDATALYIQRMLNGHRVRISRIACGLPAGGHLEYMDSLTISQALEGRHNL
ncbi:MAG: recombination protein RecR [Candidatus Glassbacteria bacterium]|nr:recombination protein RecR [Candidatus Glassbacteria bacterium]